MKLHDSFIIHFSEGIKLPVVGLAGHLMFYIILYEYSLLNAIESRENTQHDSETGLLDKMLKVVPSSDIPRFMNVLNFTYT